MKKYAITDIHGCLLSFEALLDKIAFSTADELYLLGDYIDRGPDSKRVLDKIMQLREEGYTLHCLAGNHDLAMLDAKTDAGFRRDWHFYWGGEQTMDSFEIKTLDELDWKYWEFITELEMVIEVDDYILVHAGLDFTVKDPLRPDVNMLYIRNWYDQIRKDWLGDRVIVHGHTPISTKQTTLMLHRLPFDQVIDIDNGCFASHLPGRGHLCAFDLSERELFFQKTLDDVSRYWNGKR